MTHFCPECWSQLKPDEIVCPYCKFDLAGYSGRPYEELIRALRHPIPENRAMAIQLLGELRSERALGALESILRGDSDFYVLREVLHALAKMDSLQIRATLLSATHHPSKLVSRLAERLLARTPRKDTIR